MVSPDIFTPGIRVKLMALSMAKAKLASQLIGCHYKKYIIIELPVVGGVAARMEPGTDWSMNFINHGELIGFTSQVQGSCRRPVPLVFMSYPGAAERTSLRQAKRFPVSISALCSLKNGEPQTDDVSAPCLIRDISEGGCQMVSTCMFQPGETITLTLDLPEKRQLDGLLAEVKSSRDLGGRYLHGLSFSAGFGLDSYRKLLRFIENLSSIPIRV